MQAARFMKSCREEMISDNQATIPTTICDLLQQDKGSGGDEQVRCIQGARQDYALGTTLKMGPLSANFWRLVSEGNQLDLKGLEQMMLVKSAAVVFNVVFGLDCMK